MSWPIGNLAAILRRRALSAGFAAFPGDQADSEICLLGLSVCRCVGLGGGVPSNSPKAAGAQFGLDGQIGRYAVPWRSAGQSLR